MNMLLCALSVLLVTSAPQPKIYIPTANLLEIDHSYSGLYTDLIANTVRSSNKFEVITNNDISSLFKYDEEKEKFGSDDFYSMEELSRLMVADLLLESSFSNIDKRSGRKKSTYLVNIKVYDLVKKKVVTSTNFKVSSDVEDMNQVIQERISELIETSLSTSYKTTRLTENGDVKDNTSEEMARIAARDEDSMAAIVHGVNNYPTINFETKAESLRAGSIVNFGEYEQDNMKNNGKEPIEWMVVNVDGRMVQLLSLYGLESYPFKVEKKSRGNVKPDVAWIRWLNDTFPINSFAKKDRKVIKRVFLFNEKEVNKYFMHGEQRTCLPTPYAKSMGNNGKPLWYLGFDGGDRFGVDMQGNIIRETCKTKDKVVRYIDFLIRPAMLIKLK